MRRLVATLTVTGNVAGAVSLQAASSSPTTGTLTSFTVTYGTASQVVLTASTASLASGTTRVLTATVEDAAGNTLTGDAGRSITFSQASGTGSVTGLTSANDTNGVATLGVTGNVTGTVSLQATSSSLTTGALGSFSVTAGSASQVVLSGSVTN